VTKIGTGQLIDLMALMSPLKGERVVSIGLVYNKRGVIIAGSNKRLFLV